jgi:metallophosphoesterase superfamily enzyme
MSAAVNMELAPGSMDSTDKNTVTNPGSPKFEGPGGWLLDADGAAVRPEARAAVVADVHLGYEWARGNGGDCVPAHSLGETLRKLDRVLGRAPVPIERLVVAGDLVESRRPCPRTDRDVAALIRWLADRGVRLVALRGNHDPPRRPPALAEVELAGWTVAHGHRPLTAGKTVTGHHHPVLRASGVSAPCFLVGPSTIILPAFSPNAAGVSLSALDLGPADVASLRCVASTGSELLDFGPVARLLRATDA